jgi:hypothetical protein
MLSFFTQHAVPGTQHYSSIPAICILGKTRSLYANDTESLSRGRLHYHPGLDALYLPGAQPYKARHLGLNIVAFYVNVDATFMFHFLDFHNGLIRRSLQHAIVATAAGVAEIRGVTKCLCPKRRCRIHIIGLAIYEHGTKATVMHGILREVR